MQNEKIHIERIKRLLERQKPNVHPKKHNLTASLLLSHLPPIHPPFTPHSNEREIKQGEVWARKWEQGELIVRLEIPAEFAGLEVGLFFDCDGEACVFKDGKPFLGLTPKVDWYHNAAKYYVPLSDSAIVGEKYELYIQASANDLFGAGKDEYSLKECALVSLDSQLRSRLIDIELLLNLALALPEGAVRRKRILYGLNDVCNLFHTDIDEADAILSELLSKPAHASALTAYSVGHAHLDLAWLWPIRETKRKGGRTFANALRNLERYPEYIFGASQAQLYKWMKELYPGLYSEVKEAVKESRWEVQGASWVEFDTNLSSGESIIRQFMYGKRFFNKEFGITPDVLWLPDCFGFNGNLPQLMKGCGVNYFMTQKLSWNETNVFPHHIFVWQGLDGSEVLAHQLPTNDYNFSNNPSSFLQTEERFAQSELSDAFLNLYGIGDGGGGPTLNHIEYGLRQQNLEGVSKFRFSKAQSFFDYLSTLDRTKLPMAYGELYLEFHRGTYTTQALMKKNNRRSEELLALAEYLAVLAGMEYPQELLSIWEDTLLLQFHDILPGSSIGMVYDEAAQISKANHEKLVNLAQDYLYKALGSEETSRKQVSFFNNTQWHREEWIKLESSKSFAPDPCLLDCFQADCSYLKLRLEPFSSLILNETEEVPQTAAAGHSYTLENDYLKSVITEKGTISSLILKETGREMLASESNLIKLWEDEPNNWGAWDINHFYRETTPQVIAKAELVAEKCLSIPGKYQRLVLNLWIGDTCIEQVIELGDTARCLKISHKLDWKEKHKMLRAHFYPSVQASVATYEIAMASIKRSTKPKNAWEAAQFEVPAHRFADLSQSDCGLAILNDSKYGYRVIENEMELNLLRSPADVDPEADMHTQAYTYAIFPHEGDFEHSEVVREADLLNRSIYSFVGSFTATGIQRSGLHFEGDGIKLETIKPAQDGQGRVFRFYEFKGKDSILKLSTDKAFSKAWLCNMIEEQGVELPQALPITLHIKAHQILTVLLED